ncbi:MAG: hypothetical protein ACRDFB_08890, partial [Rhabdochlamydiaceae bacterium]
MITVLPGILEQSWEEIDKKLQQVSPFAKEIHIDLIDGKFAHTKTFFDPQPFKKYSDRTFFELHMMVDNPLQYLKPWADAGFKRFIGHVEKMSHIDEFVAEGQLLGEVGLAIDVNTSIEHIKVNLDYLDCLLVMTAHAGMSGQEFMPDCLAKVRELRKKTLIPITVDGGINKETLPQAAKAGANRFVATSALFTSGDTKKNYHLLTKLAEEHMQ